MKTYTNEDLRNQRACYDPVIYCEEGKGYTLLDYLNHDTCPAKDRIWCVTRFLDDRSNRLFAVWCAREVLNIAKGHDLDSLRAIGVAERFANGAPLHNELAQAHLVVRHKMCNNIGINYIHQAACAASYDNISASIYDATSIAVDAAGYAFKVEHPVAATYDSSSVTTYDANALSYEDYHDARDIACRNERKKQIEKLKEEIKAGNWTEK